VSTSKDFILLYKYQIGGDGGESNSPSKRSCIKICYKLIWISISLSPHLPAKLYVTASQ